MSAVREFVPQEEVAFDLTGTGNQAQLAQWLAECDYSTEF